VVPQPVRIKTHIVIAVLCFFSFSLPLTTQANAATTSSIEKSYWISPNKDRFFVHNSVSFRAMINIADLGYVPDVAFIAYFQDRFDWGRVCTGVWKRTAHPNRWRLMTCTGAIFSDERAGIIQLGFMIFTRDNERYYMSKVLTGRFSRST